MRLASFILLCLLQEALGAGFYDSSSDVVSLTKNNFAQEVSASPNVWIVEFYAPWCQHCQKLTPEWIKVASNLKGLVKVGAVNCDEEKELAGHFKIQGLPTIKLFPSEQTIVETPQGKAMEKKAVDYSGAREATAIVNFAISNLPNYVKKVTASTIDSFLSGNLATVLLFTEKSTTTPLYKALAIDFKDRLKFGEVQKSEDALVKRFNVKKFPQLLVIKDATSSPVVFDGKLSHDALFTFLEPHASKLQNQQQQQQQQSKKSQTKVETEVLKPEIHAIKTQKDFEEKCTNKSGICLIAILDPLDEVTPHAERLQVLQKITDKYYKRLRAMWINGPKQFQLSESLSGLAGGFPQTLILNPGKLRYTPHLGSFDFEALDEFLSTVLNGSKRNIPIQKLPILVEEQPDEPIGETEEGKGTKKKDEL